MDRKEGFEMDGMEKTFSSFQTGIFLLFFYSFSKKRLLSSSWISDFPLIQDYKDIQQLMIVCQECALPLVHLVKLSVELVQHKLKN
jgi:hypothetical protein